MNKYKGKILCVASSKGGVGKSIFATILAGVYSYLNKKVLLIDMDLSSGGISVLLNLDKGKTIYNLSDDILNNRFKEHEIYVKHYNEYIDVLPTCKDPREGNKIDSKILEQIITIYQSHYDVIILDTTHTPTNATLLSLDIADKILLMVSDNPVDLKNTHNLLTVLKNVSKNNIKIILNNAFRNEKNYFKRFDIKNYINHNIDYILPVSMFIKDINNYLMEGEILVLNSKLSFKIDKDRDLLVKMAKDFIGDMDEN